MSRLVLAFAALLALAVGSVPAYADGPAARPAPEPRTPPALNRSPTDEYVPPSRVAPRAQRPARRAQIVRRGDTGLTGYIASLPRYLPPPLLGDAAPGSGPLVYSYSYAPPLYYGYSTIGPATGLFSQDFDGAPCPTRSRESLGELFACTLR